MSATAMAARIEELEALLAAKQGGAITPKVAARSGMVSVYGFGRKPLNFYKDQIDRLIRDPEGRAIVLDFCDRPEVLALVSLKDDDEATKASKALARKASKAPFVKHPKDD